MSVYRLGTGPKCPTALPGCVGEIRQRGSKQCGYCRQHNRPHRAPLIPVPLLIPSDAVILDREKQRVNARYSLLNSKYQEALAQLAQRDYELGALGVLGRGLDTFAIEPKLGHGTSEATPVLVASDWHVEENVGGEVGTLNTYNLEIATQRATSFFRNGARLLALLAHDVNISTVILALLGDFISNDIHEEFPELNEQSPTLAIVSAQNMLISGIEFLLANTPYTYIIPCHSGNHARTTRTTRFGAENGHSLEYLMYLHMQAHFRHEPRVTFLIAPGMHSYIHVYDKTIRFQHGHAIKYGGGIGGIFIPTYKAISQWSKARHADLDVFGHFHQIKDGGNFLCNGSLIGYNAFALSIKADFEHPRQLLFLMDKKRGRTCTWPILVS